MIDPILEHQPAWRYCRVRSGEKKPYPADWQNNPLKLLQVDSKNIGLILGPKGFYVDNNQKRWDSFPHLTDNNYGEEL